jgi:hypothetical protein
VSTTWLAFDHELRVQQEHTKRQARADRPTTDIMQEVLCFSEHVSTQAVVLSKQVMSWLAVYSATCAPFGQSVQAS